MDFLNHMEGGMVKVTEKRNTVCKIMYGKRYRHCKILDGSAQIYFFFKRSNIVENCKLLEKCKYIPRIGATIMVFYQVFLLSP
jgi:hypothetical protein